MKTVIIALVLFIGGTYLIQAIPFSNQSTDPVQNIVDTSIETSQKLQDNFDNSLCIDFKNQDCDYKSLFYEVDVEGKELLNGAGKVFILDPSSSGYSYQVGLPFSVESPDKFQFFTMNELVNLEKNKIGDKQLLFAINADYIDLDGTPQGLNSRQGEIYKGLFADTRSSFGLSRPDQNGKITPTIAQGLRADVDQNYFLAGGNGRFFRGKQFIDICTALGEFACSQVTIRSMVAITDQGYVIFSVYNDSLNPLTPDKFRTYFTNIALDNELGSIQDAMLFDGGRSPAMWYGGEWKMQSSGPIGSAFLIYY